MKYQLKLLAVCMNVLLLFACKEKGSYTKIENKHVDVTSTVHEIVIIEAINASNYAYLHVDENGVNYWMAIPNTPVTIGETYYYEGGMVMKNFESKGLNKTFDFITFVEGIRSTEKALVIKQENLHSNSTKITSGKVKIQQPDNGTSLYNLFSKKESFSKKVIIVSGKVIKVNNGIMDKNWVHISDGTQFEDEKSLTITTLETVKVGDLVTFKGILTLDKDFGYGYVYSILLEDSALVK